MTQNVADRLQRNALPEQVESIGVANAMDAFERNLQPTPLLPCLSVAAKKGASLAVEREPGVRLRSGRRWAQEWRGSDYFFSEAELSSLLTRGVR